MPIEYINRKGNTFFLHEGKTKKGNPRYTCSRFKEDALEVIPKEYEIYENPNAQVFLRKIQPRLIQEKEEALLKRTFKALIDRKYCKLTVFKETITIYFAHQDVDRIRKIYESMPITKTKGVEVLIDQEMTYIPIIRLILQSPKERLFVLKMENFKEDYEVWKIVDGPNSFEGLLSTAKKEVDLIYEAYAKDL